VAAKLEQFTFCGFGSRHTVPVTPMGRMPFLRIRIVSHGPRDPTKTHALSVDSDRVTRSP